MVKTNMQNSGIDSTSITTLLDKPLRPIFIHPDSSLEFDLSDEYYPVILSTASKCVANGHERVGGFVYVQGAADDEESWAHGLTSAQFWQNQEELLRCRCEDELVQVISQVIQASTPPTTALVDWSQIGATNISLGIGGGMSGIATIVCGDGAAEVFEDSSVLNLSILVKSKPLTVMVQRVFPAAVSFALKHGILNNSSILVLATDSSRQLLDLSIAVTLVLLSLFLDDHGTYPRNAAQTGIVTDRRHLKMTKEIIRRRLTWIITARGHQVERVSRQTLIIVNTYLMSPSNVLRK